MTSAVEGASAPLAAAYHLIEVPVVTKFATVGLLPEQKDCAALPVGAVGVGLIVAVTSNLEVLSQPDTVCEAK